MLFRFFCLRYILLIGIVCSALQMLAQRQDTLVLIDHINYQGNKITKLPIIEREMTISEGDTLSLQDFRKTLQACQNNLMNTSLFNIVEVDELLAAKYNGLYYYFVNVKMQERWYILPLPILELAERNFNTWWQDKDFSLLNYGMFLNWENFRGHRERLSLLLQYGYDRKWDVSYYIPYINKAQTWGISLSYTEQKQHAINYITMHNKALRYKLHHDFIAQAQKASVTLHYRPNIHISQALSISANKHRFHDSLQMLNPAFARYPLHHYAQVNYEFRNDHRDYKIYPLKGYYYSISIEKKGLKLFKESHIDLWAVKLDARKYWQWHPKWYSALAFSGRAGTQNQSFYFTNKALGYRPYFVRGYEYYVVDGLNYVLGKAELKYALFNKMLTTLPIISNPKFNKVPWSVYLTTFLDSGFVPGSPTQYNSLRHHLLLGGGIGLNLITYYDMVFRAELSTNKMGETALFLHFIAPL